MGRKPSPSRSSSISRLTERLLLGIGAAGLGALCGVALLSSRVVSDAVNRFTDSRAKSTAVVALSDMLSIQREIATHQAASIALISPSEATHMASELSYLSATQQSLQEVLLELTPAGTGPVTEGAPPTLPPLLFADNFDLGLSPNWIYLSGNPFVVNDRLTASEPTWLVVGDPSWSNYTIDFWGESSGCGEVENENAVTVRMVDSENLVAFLWTECDTMWLERHGSKWFEVPNSKTKGVGREKAHLIVLVEGARFTAYLGDEKLSSFFSESFPEGMVGLMLGSQTQIDDFTIR